MESSFQHNYTENQWDEVVNDLWSEILSCLRSKSKHSHKSLSLLHTTQCISCNLGFTNLPVSSTTGRYGFDCENKEERADDLYQDLNADISDATEYSFDFTPPSPSISLDVAIGEEATVSESDMPRPTPISNISCGALISETAIVSESDMSVRQESEALRQGLEDPETREEMINEKKGRKTMP